MMLRLGAAICVATLGLSYRTALLLDPGKVNATPRRGETLFRTAFHTITFAPCVDFKKLIKIHASVKLATIGKVRNLTRILFLQVAMAKSARQSNLELKLEWWV